MPLPRVLVWKWTWSLKSLLTMLQSSMLATRPRGLLLAYNLAHFLHLQNWSCTHSSAISSINNSIIISLARGQLKRIGSIKKKRMRILILELEWHFHNLQWFSIRSFYLEINYCSNSNLLISFLRCDTWLYKWGTQWELNSLVKAY